jgi:phage N-6-adenine-methyltransferase
MERSLWFLQNEKVSAVMKTSNIEHQIPKTGASFARGSSRQDYATPDDFLAAVRAKFGPIAFDLAASKENNVTRNFYYATNNFFDMAANSLAQNWSDLTGNLWLNPPFDSIAPWAKKCSHEASRGAKILFLVPASVGSNWFASHVILSAHVYFLNPRLKFKGAVDPYPKDCLLAAYGFGNIGRCEVWRWK